jgi:hypothetical protein
MNGKLTAVTPTARKRYQHRNGFPGMKNGIAFVRFSQLQRIVTVSAKYGTVTAGIRIFHIFPTRTKSDL